MTVFRRRRGESDRRDEGRPREDGPDGDGFEDGDEPGTADEPDASDGARHAPQRSDRSAGPWDVSEVDDPAAGGRVNLGGMWLPGRPELEVRIEADQATSQVVAVTLVLGEGALQVQPFAAPRTEPIWAEVRDEIRAGITAQGGTADEVEGPLGTELRTRVPVRAADGSSGVQPARFIGVDGPRWFLRGVVTGRPAVDTDTDADLIALFRDVVVVRGDGPMAPREPIPLELPAPPSAAAAEPGGAPAPEADAEEARARSQHELKPFERGPEITEIR